LKVSDFGFAKMVASEEMKQNPTAQTSVGTPFYMSPQVIFSEPYTIKCDVWSLGVVYYKMIYNLMPWERTDNILVLVERMRKPLEFPPHIKISDWIKQLLREMLTIDESKRASIKRVQ
jgi:polo-like kinase 4